MHGHNHDAQDDMADWAQTTFGPAEACTELGADPDRLGCGPRGTGAGPFEWLLRGLLILALVVSAALLVASLP